MTTAFISPSAGYGVSASVGFISLLVGGRAICHSVLNTPHEAEYRTRQSCGFFTSIGFLWPGSAYIGKQPERAKVSGRLHAVFKYLAATLNKWRSLNKHEGTITMAQATQGAIRPKTLTLTELAIAPAGGVA